MVYATALRMDAPAAAQKVNQMVAKMVAWMDSLTVQKKDDLLERLTALWWGIPMDVELVLLTGTPLVEMMVELSDDLMDVG